MISTIFFIPKNMTRSHQHTVDEDGSASPKSLTLNSPYTKFKEQRNSFKLLEVRKVVTLEEEGMWWQVELQEKFLEFQKGAISWAECCLPGDIDFNGNSPYRYHTHKKMVPPPFSKAVLLQRSSLITPHGFPSAPGGTPFLNNPLNCIWSHHRNVNYHPYAQKLANFFTCDDSIINYSSIINSILYPQLSMEEMEMQGD